MAGKTSNQLVPSGKRAIIVLQRGWVAVGKYAQDGDVGSLKGASIIRRWGTTKGLGELAEAGPQKNTVLDACPDISFHVREVVLAMRCSNAWGK